MSFIEFFTTGSTLWFTLAIGVFFIIGLFAHKLGKGWQRLSPIIPSLCTQIGILGTFTGIAIALQGAAAGGTLDTGDIIKGLSTSVGSSILGFAAFILLKIRIQIRPDEGYPGEEPSDRIASRITETSGGIIAAVDGLKGELQEQLRTQHAADQRRAGAAEAVAKSDREAIAQAIGDLKGRAENITDAIREEHDKTRDSVRDLQESGKAGMKKLVDSFQQFQKTMSEEIIKGLMASLKDAFETFNDQLAKHVGGNFEKLNEIVGNLGRWQEDWKDHVDKGTEALNTATESLRESAGHMTTIVGRLTAVAEATGTIPDDVKALIEVHGALKERAEEMAARAQDLRESGQQAIDEAVRALKTAQASLEEGTNTAEEIRESLRNSLRSAQETLQNSLDEVRQALQNSMQSAHAALNTALGEARENLSGSVQDARNALSGALDETEKGLQGTLADTRTTIEESQKSLRESMNESQSAFRSTLDEIGATLQKSAETLNQTITTQITERVQEMAEILAGIIDTLNERVQAIEGENQ